MLFAGLHMNPHRLFGEAATAAPICLGPGLSSQSAGFSVLSWVSLTFANEEPHDCPSRGETQFWARVFTSSGELQRWLGAEAEEAVDCLLTSQRARPRHNLVSGHGPFGVVHEDLPRPPTLGLEAEP